MKVNFLYTVLITVTLVMANSALTSGQNAERNITISISQGKALKNTPDGIKITSGNCRLFEIKHISGGDPRNDTQVTKTLTFVIPEGKDHFTIKNFPKSEAYVVISGCRCVDLGYNPVMSGFIRGELLKDGQWKISADVVARGKDSGEERVFQHTD